MKQLITAMATSHPMSSFAVDDHATGSRGFAAECPAWECS